MYLFLITLLLFPSLLRAYTNPVLAPTAYAELMLSPTPSAGTYNVLWLADTHAPEASWVANYTYSGVLALNSETDVKFICLGGDWTYTGADISEWNNTVYPILSLITVAPVFAVKGNHENSIDWLTSTHYGTIQKASCFGVLDNIVNQSYAGSYSQNPQTGRDDYFFDYANTRYIFLDTSHGNEYTGASNNNGRTSLSNKQVRWLVDTLSGVPNFPYIPGVSYSKAMPYVIVSMHRPAGESETAFLPALGVGFDKNTSLLPAYIPSFETLMQDFGIDFVICGHMSGVLQSFTRNWTSGSGITTFIKSNHNNASSVLGYVRLSLPAQPGNTIVWNAVPYSNTSTWTSASTPVPSPTPFLSSNVFYFNGPPSARTLDTTISGTAFQPAIASASPSAGTNFTSSDGEAGFWEFNSPSLNCLGIYPGAWKFVLYTSHSSNSAVAARLYVYKLNQAGTSETLLFTTTGNECRLATNSFWAGKNEWFFVQSKPITGFMPSDRLRIKVVFEQMSGTGTTITFSYGNPAYSSSITIPELIPVPSFTSTPFIPTSTPTYTCSITFTSTTTFTSSLTFTNTATITQTASTTPIPSNTATYTFTRTPSSTETISYTPTLTLTFTQVAYGIKVFPNPFNRKTSDLLHFINLAPESKVSIYNIAGEKVAELVADRNGSASFAPTLAQGIYFYIVREQSAIAKGKFAIM